MKHTTSSPLHKLHLFQFKKLDMGEFVGEYTNIITPHEAIDENTLSVYTPAKTKQTNRKRGTIKPEIVECKCRYLQDAIIRRAFAQDNTLSFSLSSEVFKAVIGAEYKTMLEVLTNMGYIALGDGSGGADKHWYYMPSSYSTYYTLIDTDIEETIIVNQRIQKYKEETSKQVEKLISTNANGYVEDAFLNQYVKSLNYIRIADYDGLRSFIKTQVQDNPNASIYYDFVFKELENKNKRITRIDRSHRFYHILTNVKREVKKYLTIDFMLDCRNSHPMLFNHFIFEHHNISRACAYRICSFLKFQFNLLNNNILNNNTNIPVISGIKGTISLNHIHNVAQNFYNSLEYNVLEKSDFAKLKEDEVQYIYDTCNGVLWDNICNQHPDMDRGAVKESMFGAVFYAKTSVPDRYYDFAKEFKQQYPTVFDLISSWKADKSQEWVKQYMSTHALPYQEKASLSVAMMALEADIFTTILKRLYSKRWNSVHVHDCIVIPQDNNKNHPTKDQVLLIMEDVFKQYGLAPTFSCE